MIALVRCRPVVVLALLLVLGCAGRTRTGTEETGTLPPRTGGGASLGFDAPSFYRQAGLLAGGAPVTFVGTVHFLASHTPDTTLLLIGVSLPSNALTFVRENDRFRAGYEIRALIRQNGVQVDEVSAREQVRVGSFLETTRGDESIIFQEYVGLAPGTYELTLVVRDLESARTSTSAADLTLPRYVEGYLSSPIPVYEAAPRTRLDSLPELIASPRASAVFGRDTTVAVYVEAYGGANDVPLEIRIRGERGAMLYEDSTMLARTGALFSGTIDLPVARLGIGATSLAITRLDTRDSSITPLIVGFGDDLPLVSFEDMLDYLQYFTQASRLRAMREAPPEQRPEMWADFLRSTDPDPGTAEHEGLRRYFERIAYANLRFREEGSIGWRSDRGMVFVALGEPDQILEQTRSEFAGRGRVQVWEYRMHRLQLVFVDQTGFGRWRLTSSSEVEFRSALQRLRSL